MLVHDFSFGSIVVVVLLVLTPYLLLAFRQVHNDLRKDVNRLQVENNDLANQADRLQKKTSRLASIEKGLSSTLERQGTSTDTFVQQVKENAKVQAEMEHFLMMDIMQNILTTVIRSDMDSDFQIDPEEVNALILRIKTLPGVEGVDETQIRALLLTQGNGLDAVVAMVKNIHLQTGEKKLIQVSSKNLLMKMK